MIATREEMIQIEKQSGYTEQQLMEMVGKKIADTIQRIFPMDSKICILVGKGNNGGDGYVIAHYLENYHCMIYMVDGKPSTTCAKKAYQRVKDKVIPSIDKSMLMDCDLIVDCVYGFSYHGVLKPSIKKLFRIINSLDITVWSIDINSGAECDSGCHDIDTLHSTCTFALDCYKPFHMLQKDHCLFDNCALIDLGLKHPTSSIYHTMDEEIFFDHFPKKAENAYKGTYGKTLIVGGSYGMAGALSLNILGAMTLGASYINVACPHEIYSIVASHHITPVFHPFSHDDYEKVLIPLIKEAKAIAFGSGATKLSRKVECMDAILQNSSKPVVLDAEALRLLQHNTWILRFVKCPVIVTPHIGEFAGMLSQTVEIVQEKKISYALEFAKKNRVYVVLKGANTIVASPSGDVYINQSGNQALGQAGSGDLLTGMLVALLTFTTDVFQAICMAVWLHGYLADIGINQYSTQAFPIEQYPAIMQQLFKKHGL